MPERSEGIPFFFLASDMNVAWFQFSPMKWVFDWSDFYQTLREWQSWGPAGPETAIWKMATRGPSLFSNASHAYVVKVHNLTNDQVPKSKSYYKTYTLFHNKISKWDASDQPSLGIPPLVSQSSTSGRLYLPSLI